LTIEVNDDGSPTRALADLLSFLVLFVAIAVPFVFVIDIHLSINRRYLNNRD
jgi:hypothetical protein